MPNVTIFAKKDHLYTIKRHVWDLTANLPFADEMVVTVIVAECEDRDGVEQPYIRIYSSEPEHIEPLVVALKPLNMKIDIETADLTGFYPKEEGG